MFDEDKYEYYESRYAMLGAVYKCSDREMSVLSPYFIKVQFNPQKMKKTADFVAKVEKSVKSITKDVMKKFGKDVRAEMLKKDDVDTIVNALPEISEALNSLSTYILFQDNINKILIQESSILDGGSILMNSFGPGFLALQDHDYTVEQASQTRYKKLSNEEFFNITTGIVADGEADDDDRDDSRVIYDVDDDGFIVPKASIDSSQTSGNQSDDDSEQSTSIIYSFAQFKKEFPRAEWFECYIPVVFYIDISD